jgi:hypothetical protein
MAQAQSLKPFLLAGSWLRGHGGYWLGDTQISLLLHTNFKQLVTSYMVPPDLCVVVTGSLRGVQLLQEGYGWFFPMPHIPKADPY